MAITLIQEGHSPNIKSVSFSLSNIYLLKVHTKNTYEFSICKINQNLLHRILGQKAVAIKLRFLSFSLWEPGHTLSDYCINMSNVAKLFNVASPKG